MAQDVVPNDGYVSLINPDGTAHTLKWIGVNRNGLTLNHPLGSDIANGMLYVVDIDTVRWFDMKTGEPKGNVQVPGVIRFNDLEVAATARSTPRRPARRRMPTSWKVYKITPQGQASVVITGAPLNLPNGIAFDAQGQPGGREHRHQRRPHLLARRQARHHRAGRGPRQRRHRRDWPTAPST